MFFLGMLRSYLYTEKVFGLEWFPETSFKCSPGPLVGGVFF